MELMIGDTKAVIAAIPLKECIKIPGIKDGSLFRKNVRQSLGTGNKVNKYTELESIMSEEKEKLKWY